MLTKNKVIERGSKMSQGKTSKKQREKVLISNRSKISNYDMSSKKALSTLSNGSAVSRSKSQSRNKNGGNSSSKNKRCQHVNKSKEQCFSNDQKKSLNFIGKQLMAKFLASVQTIFKNMDVFSRGYIS